MRLNDDGLLKEIGWTRNQLGRALLGLTKMPRSRRRRVTLINAAKGRPSTGQRAALARLICERLEIVPEG
jgi:hypothetical protein